MVKVSDFPMTGITLTRGANLRMSSISISRRLKEGEGDQEGSSECVDRRSLRVACWWDKVETCVDSEVFESGVS